MYQYGTLKKWIWFHIFFNFLTPISGSSRTSFRICIYCKILFSKGCLRTQLIAKVSGLKRHQWVCTVCHVNIFQNNYIEMMKRYKQLLTYIKSAVTRNYSEKSINSILDYISTSKQVCVFSFLKIKYKTKHFSWHILFLSCGSMEISFRFFNISCSCKSQLFLNFELESTNILKLVIWPGW